MIRLVSDYTVVPVYREFDRCYACDAKPSRHGVRDLRPEGGEPMAACERHAEPGLRRMDACIYCSGPVRAGSLAIDGDFAHKACHREASQ